MWIRRAAMCACTMTATTVVTLPAAGGIIVYQDGPRFAEFGGRIQVQYRNDNPSDAEATDVTFFRRLRPYLKGSVTENWSGIIQVDFGANLNDNEVNIKDAFMQYHGISNHKLTIGNTKTPFSREFLASSKRFQLVEISPAGDHNRGSPDRMLGIKLDGKTAESKLTYAACVGSQNHDPAVISLDLDSPANNQDDWNEGPIVAGRVEVNPMGAVKYDRGDFHTKDVKVTINGAGYYWKNDGDNNTWTDAAADSSLSTSKVDLDEAYGLEASAGLRGRGVSIDVEYQRIHGKTVVSGFTGGIYKNGETDLDIVSVQGGYMLLGSQARNVEIVGGYDVLDASNYVNAWTRALVGANFFVNKYKVKFQVNYAYQQNFLGADGVDNDTIWIQAQYVF